MINAFNPRPEYHSEADATIDRLMQSTARALEMGVFEDDALKVLLNRGLEMHEAVNIVRAAAILASH